MKLTTDLIAESFTHINALTDRELVLRDLKIPAIENLGATKDLNDTIDFTNNDLRVLGNFPRMIRLQHLLLSNNRISKLEPFHEQLPNLTTLIMTNNTIEELGDIEPLELCKNLTHLSLLDNPVTKKAHYRLYVIHKLPSVRVLDFNRVKDKERQEAAQLFLEDGEENELAKSITRNKTKTFEPGEGVQQKTGHGLTPAEQLKIKEAIKQATSLDEISRLERLLKAGHLPSNTKDNTTNDDA
ncbi:U2 small nuclear ribonucleoprotein A' [Apophysomyces sp. BC1034]|nr:U2 small nuclear ribonucleoprotein A' [Apophysomyces sp. BC1015]KAG0178054.1 U2 small nuclear ribonucleoprotein A' [Apophysomyces sp. BC1021]KAG0188328.1 U2 small nuclear ribonucleoprotein A' [Apophysomyces sp. BC1034]